MMQMELEAVAEPAAPGITAPAAGAPGEIQNTKDEIQKPVVGEPVANRGDEAGEEALTDAEMRVFMELGTPNPERMTARLIEVEAALRKAADLSPAGKDEMADGEAVEEESDDEEEVANAGRCKRYNHGNGCSCSSVNVTGANMKKQKGATKNPQDKNVRKTTLKTRPNASDKEKKEVIAKGVDRTSKHGGNVIDAVEIPEVGSIDIRSGTVGRKSNQYQGGSGTAHLMQKHGKEEISPQKVGEILVRGEVKPDPKYPTRLRVEHDESRVSIEKVKKLKTGRISKTGGKIHTAHLIRERNDKKEKPSQEPGSTAR